ncbi:hypothetical protein PIROE2DRAFT_8273 [Piromyces sp. E2]|nr:hypothetical protein PIROE2DRAFT_8273 [Piromyces sp. E2]|eukprot:OUM64818.1 hypothetical protein PIROE2DRAFT_8273 [Piromyces sp. E2]
MTIYENEYEYKNKNDKVEKYLIEHGADVNFEVYFEEDDEYVFDGKAYGYGESLYFDYYISFDVNKITKNKYAALIYAFEKHYDDVAKC